MSVEVRPARSRRELEAFAKLPWSIHRNGSPWVPPLLRDFVRIFDREKNPFFEHGDILPMLALRDGEVVGRIAAIRNEAHERFWNEACAFFGFFECVDDPSVARALVDAARERATEWDAAILRGPVNPSTNDECGVLIEGFDTPPAVMMPYNPPYYDRLLHEAGLAKAKDLIAYWLPTPTDGPPERLRRGAQIARQRNPEIRFRCFDTKDFAAEVARFKSVYNAAWEKNWGFVPMTDREIDHMADELKPVIDPGLIRIAEHGDRTVAFSLALPDMNQALRHANGRLFPFGLFKLLWYARKVDSVRVMVLGVLEEYRGRGLDVVLYEGFYTHAMEKGYRGGELSWILEDNTAIRRPIEEAMGAQAYKTYRIYEAPVGG